MKKQDWDKWNIQAIAILLIGVLLGGFGYHNYSEMWQERQGRIAQQGSQKTIARQEALPRPISKIVQADQVASEVKYVIRKGDTLTKIAARFCDDVSVIAKRSGIKNPHKIKAGATLSVIEKNGCSSLERVIKKHVSPGKFAVSGGASQEKRLIHPESSSWKLSSVQTIACHSAAFGKRTWREQTLAIYDCVQNRYGESIRGASQETRLPERLISAVLIAESAGNPLAVSPSGCRGFMQLLTSTAAQYGVPKNRILDPDANIRGGARVLADYLRRYSHGDLGRALASYNLGPAKVSRLMDEGFDPSSHFYVVKVKKILRLLEAERKR